MEVCERNSINFPSYGALLSGRFGFLNLSRKSSRDKLKDPTKNTSSNLDVANRRQQLRRRAVSFDPSSEMSRGDMDLGVVPGDNLFTGLAVTLYIQMQLCTRTLAGWLKERNERLASLPDSFEGVDASLNMQIFEGIMKGVQYIHSNGFMHRDLKPKNIFLDGDNLHVRIGDFGLARHDVVDKSKGAYEDYPLMPLDTLSKWDFTSNCSIHTSGVGTATYASPEQLNGSGDYDSKSDMYSAGIILFELFHPFSTGMERARCMGDLRHGRIVTEVMKRWPLQSEMMGELVSVNGEDRPSADEVLQSELFVSKDEMINRLQKQLSEQSKLLSQKQQELIERTAELRDARQLLKEKDALIYEILEDKSH
ncbi:eukaryotic translation initiation factor 2-alpha kinase 1-like [Amphiura filiformis]|uniref:eukaryotic translation initiation factor 2-alpha kinase 1-like n=1 Tax=Amphiura filiformis TaxID=82378 RepID=UPI003B228893